MRNHYHYHKIYHIINLNKGSPPPKKKKKKNYKRKKIVSFQVWTGQPTCPTLWTSPDCFRVKLNQDFPKYLRPPALSPAWVWLSDCLTVWVTPRTGIYHRNVLSQQGWAEMILGHPHTEPGPGRLSPCSWNIHGVKWKCREPAGSAPVTRSISISDCQGTEIYL